MDFSKSRNLFTRAKKSLAGGVSSNSRIKELPSPPFFNKAIGSKIYDVDQNEYIDYVLGRGPLIFGHSPKFILTEVKKHIKSGQIYGTTTKLEIDLSEKIKSIFPDMELVRYATTGTEVVELALRLSRAFTYKSKIIMFEGQYHGWTDNTLIPESNIQKNSMLNSEGIPSQSAKNIITVPWNNLNLLEKIIQENHSEIASIITSPAPECEINKNFLTNVRNLCDKWKIILIFDEVITGFRLSLGGAQKLCNIKPDLSTFAKALGGGFPISMIAGKYNIMSLLENNKVYHGGTLNSNIMSLSAANAVISHLINNHQNIYTHLYEIGNELISGIKLCAEKHNIPVIINGNGPMFKLSFLHDLGRSKINKPSIYKQFYKLIIQKGIRVEYGDHSGSIWFISTQHNLNDIKITLKAIDSVFQNISKN
ncbi:MAG: hypothetical protein CL758_00770 [Chloroflexi bacterium]|nr:hypothetical protein [Chloroflexota bacterium]|tara:strand:- start:6439 stop:7707 length:1269 start_codon:yes stop_codon:yes gene_type:complete